MHVDAVHYNIDNGRTMVLWRQFWEDRAESSFVTLPNGRRFLVLVPYSRNAYQVSEPIEETLGFRWRGELLVLACGVNNDLLVNMRTWKSYRDRAWEVVSRYVATITLLLRLLINLLFQVHNRRCRRTRV